MAGMDRGLRKKDEQQIRRQGGDGKTRGHWWQGDQISDGATTIPSVRCWERSAFWIRTVAGLLLLICAIAGVGVLCRYVQEKQGKGGAIGWFCGAVCRVCVSAGFPDWDRPIFGGFAESESENARDTEREVESEIDSWVETDADTERNTENESQVESEAVTSTPVFVGDRQVEARDVSYRDRGVNYIENRTDWIPDVTAVLQSMDARVRGRSVLIVTSHPYDAYRDGGTVSELAEVLAEALRAQGVTAVYVPIEGKWDSYVDTYREAMEIVRYQGVMMPDIGLVIDLRRSSELTEQGGVLQTDGRWADGCCAQIRLTVEGDGKARQESLGAAVWLRNALWNMEPSISRPVVLRQGIGLTAVVEGSVAVVTAEVGSLGNSYAEAGCAIPLLANAVANFC